MALRGLKGGGHITYKRMEQININDSDLKLNSAFMAELTAKSTEELRQIKKDLHQEYLKASIVTSETGDFTERNRIRNQEQLLVAEFDRRWNLRNKNKSQSTSAKDNATNV